MLNPSGDGITHVNVYSKGKTELGRLLSNFARTPFELKDHGKFESVEGYWYWLGCKNDRLRTLSGFAAKQQGRLLKAADWNNEPEFKACIQRAIKAKLEAHPRINELLKANSLPLVHYYVFGSVVHDETVRGQWILDCFNSKE